MAAVGPSMSFLGQPPPAPQAHPLPQHDEGDGVEEEAEGEHLQGIVPWWAQQQQQPAAEGQGGRSDLQHAHPHAQHSPPQQEESGSNHGPLTYILRQLFFPLLRPLSLAVKKAQGGHTGQQPPRHQRNSSEHEMGEGPRSQQQQQQEKAKKKKNGEGKGIEEEDDGRVYLAGPKLYTCVVCRMHLATDMEVISRAFQGRGGRAFLLDEVVNITNGPSEERLLMTGLHVVRDLQCAGCRTVLGWRYDKAFEPSQKYKEGKFILEKVNLRLEEEEEEEEEWRQEKW